MKRPCIFGATLCAVAIFVFCIATIAQETNEKVAVEKIARNITVKIQYLNDKENGSGVLVPSPGKTRDTYTVLTAEHILKNREFRIITFNGEKHKPNYKSIEVYQCRNPENFLCKKFNLDLATVEFTSPENYQVAKISDRGKMTFGTFIYAAGFPAKDNVNSPLEYGVETKSSPGQFYFSRQGKLLAHAQTKNQLVYTNRTLNGMSGGPLLNKEGELIGVHKEARRVYTPIGQIEGKDTSIIFRKNRSLGIPIQSYLDLSKREQRRSINTSPDDQYVETVNKLDELDNVALEKKKKGLIEVIQNFDKLIKKHDKYTAAYLGRAEAQAKYAKISTEKKDKDSNYNKAVNDYNTAIEKDIKDDAYYYNELGNIYLALERYDNAVENFKKALKIQPNDGVVYNSLGYAYIELKKPDLAIEKLNKAIKLEPKMGRAFFNRGKAYVSKGENWQSNYIKDFNKAALLDPSIKVNLASQYFSLIVRKGCALFEKEMIIEFAKKLSLCQQKR
jgi:tetratricopeptide (TPR) repeat protein